MLELAAILALSARCAPEVSPMTMAAIAHAESRFDPLAIGVNNGSAPARPRTAAEASRIARRLIAAGANIDLGLAQINAANLSRLGLSIEDAFDPCRSLEAGAAVLMAGYRPASDHPDARQQALRVALSLYNTGHPRRGFRNGYVARVEASAARLMGAPLQPAAPAPSPLPVVRLSAPLPTPTWDVFGRAEASPRLLFSASSESFSR
ncbi:lytic transglycosylase domain-containing protein [Brevundimonas sp.]|uniref:lytic transglycosylase domain-containing protein n=1 Tax=Brevundimonas sp. TaxID=1871086 RepID=UPI00289D5DFB|nr:lytic transglycosylase domain-containing protein [Brevundimonas sp.]